MQPMRIASSVTLRSLEGNSLVPERQRANPSDLCRAARGVDGPAPRTFAREAGELPSGNDCQLRRRRSVAAPATAKSRAGLSIVLRPRRQEATVSRRGRLSGTERTSSSQLCKAIASGDHASSRGGDADGRLQGREYRRRPRRGSVSKGSGRGGNGGCLCPADACFGKAHNSVCCRQDLDQKCVSQARSLLSVPVDGLVELDLGNFEKPDRHGLYFATTALSSLAETSPRR